MEITEDIKKLILAKCFRDSEDGRLKISLGNCRLDFSKTYFFNGFTKSTVKLSEMNGRDEIKYWGKVEDRGEYYALYTEGWSYIEHIEKEKKLDGIY
jgi:hypothetical protein